MGKVIIVLFLFCFNLSFSQVDRSQPKAGPAPKINFSKPYMKVLSNGLTLMVVENSKLPRVSVSLIIDNPPILERDLSGISSITGSLMGLGNKYQDKDSFNEEIDFMGASISFSSQSGFASSLSRHFPRTFEMFSNAALNPLFQQEEFQNEKDKLITNIENNEKSVTAVARKVERVHAYGRNHPNGEFSSKETVENIQLSDVEEFYESYFKPNNAYLVLIGDISVELSEELASKYFGKWKSDKKLEKKFGENSVNAFQAISNKDGMNINIVDMPNSANSEISFQNIVNLKMSDEDYHAAVLTNKILGGGPENRLEQQIREVKSFAYYSRSIIGDNKYTGTRFRATTTTKPSVTDSAIYEIANEIKKIQTELVSDEELSRVKSKFFGEFVLAMQSPATLANYALQIQSENLSDSYFEDYLTNINRVTPEKVMEVANKYFDIENGQFIITGKGSEIVKQLDNITIEGNKIPLQFLSIDGNLVERPNYDAPDGISKKDVLDKYMNAIGGIEKIENISAVSILAESEVQGMKLQQVSISAKPNKTMLETMMMGNTLLKIVFDGENGIMTQQGNTMEMPQEMVDATRNSTLPFEEIGWYSNDNVKISSLQEEKGREYYVLEIINDSGEVNSSVFYDVETGLKYKKTEKAQMPDGSEFLSEAFYLDYMPVDGVSFPHTLRIPFGATSLEFVVVNITLNPDVSDSFIIQND
tara:strand:+ start:2229 stop:4340 length:2112 start_codon:yes stop_codon:yes gene_type:complete